jgi:AcrR family transcriptional regulator
MKATHRKGENARTTRVRQIVVDAAAGLLVREGAGAVTAVRIVADTGIARTTIYRHWPDSTALLLDAIDQVVRPHVPTAITDNLEADLIVALTNLQMRMRKKPFRFVFTALLDHANRDQKLVPAQRRFVNGVLQPMRDIITAALQRGDLPSSVHVETACAQLAGPLVLQHVMLRSTISDELISETITQFLRRMRDGG